MNDLSLQNIFGHGYRKNEVESLIEFGFSYRSQDTRFAGAQHLHFIDFQQPPSLEIIKVTDHEAYRDFVPPGMEPYAPGLNFCLAEESELSVETIRVRFAHWEPYLLHENYEGGQEEHKPGWNYLNFRQPILPGIFIWVTSLDPPFPATHPRTNHPNTVTGVESLIFNLEAKQFKKLSELTDQPVKNGFLEINNIKLYSREAAPLKEAFPKKVFPLTFIVLRAESLNYFLTLEPRPQLVQYQGKQTVWIPTPPRSWDILVTS